MTIGKIKRKNGISRILYRRWNPKNLNRVGVILNAIVMLTKVFKVKDTKTNAYGCCDQCGGCQCNN